MGFPEDYEDDRLAARAWMAKDENETTWLSLGPPAAPSLFEKLWAKYNATLRDNGNEYAAVISHFVDAGPHDLSIYPGDVSEESINDLLVEAFTPADGTPPHFEPIGFPGDFFPWQQWRFFVEDKGDQFGWEPYVTKEILAKLTAHFGWRMFQFSLWQELTICYGLTSRGHKL